MIPSGWRDLQRVNAGWWAPHRGRRYIIQERLKITGACWKNENALNMLALRTVRANGDWDQYWQAQKKHWFMFANSLNRSLMQLTNSNEKIKK